jgi:hypothetical protein
MKVGMTNQNGMLVPENSNLPYGQFQILTYALDKENDLPKNYLQIPYINSITDPNDQISQKKFS